MKKYQENGLVSGNTHIVLHYKVIVVQNSKDISDDTFIYVGNHNFTQAAWGRIIDQKETLESINYELGYIFLPWKGTMNAKKHLVGKLGIDIEAEFYEKSDTPFFN